MKMARPCLSGGLIHPCATAFQTIFLIDYFTVPVFRGELQHALNRGEAVHKGADQDKR